MLLGLMTRALLWLLIYCEVVSEIVVNCFSPKRQNIVEDIVDVIRLTPQGHLVSSVRNRPFEVPKISSQDRTSNGGANV